MKAHRNRERRETLGYWPAEDAENGQAVGLVTNLTEEGLQIHSRHGFLKKQVLTVRIKVDAIPAGKDTISLVIENVWSRPSGVPGLYHAGFKVLAASTKAKRSLRNLFKAFSYAAPGDQSPASKGAADTVRIE